MPAKYREVKFPEPMERLLQTATQGKSIVRNTFEALRKDLDRDERWEIAGGCLDAPVVIPCGGTGHMKEGRLRSPLFAWRYEADNHARETIVTICRSLASRMDGSYPFWFDTSADFAAWVAENCPEFSPQIPLACAT